jgi:hypothetical protein
MFVVAMFALVIVAGFWVVVVVNTVVGMASLVSEGVLAFLRCRDIDIYGVHKNVKFLRHL